MKDDRWNTDDAGRAQKQPPGNRTNRSLNTSRHKVVKEKKEGKVRETEDEGTGMTKEGKEQDSAIQPGWMAVCTLYRVFVSGELIVKLKGRIICEKKKC